MSADYTNLIRVPGITARVVVDADYDWKELGALLADGYDGEQAEMLDALAQGLWKQPKGKTYGGLMQLQYVADHIDGDPGSYDKEAIIWFLRELLIRLEGATVAKEEFNAWLAEHDAELIEGLADEALPTLTPGLSDETSGGAVRHWLREKARQRREEQS